MTLFLIISALVGATLIVTSSTLFRPVRRLWPALLGCSQCTGVWVGIAAGASGISLGYGLVLDAIILGAATSFLAQLADGVLLNLLGEPDSDEGTSP